MGERRLFDDSWKRVDRAVAHAKAFTDEWNGTFDPKSTKSIVERKDDRTWVVKAVFPPLRDNSLALELGEFAYQLMAALDGAVFEASVVAGKEDPPANVEGLYFPMAKKLRTFNESAFNNGPLSQDLKFWVESIQPYNAGKRSEPHIDRMIHCLSTLHSCARKDRHRRLNVLAAPPTRLAYDFEFEGPGSITFSRELAADFFKEKYEFLEFGMDGFVDTLTTNLKLKTDITIEVRVEEIPVQPGGSVTDEMRDMLKSVDHILRLFEADISDPPH